MRGNHAFPRGVRRQDRGVRLGPTELELVLHPSVAPHQLDDVPVGLNETDNVRFLAEVRAPERHLAEVAPLGDHPRLSTDARASLQLEAPPVTSSGKVDRSETSDHLV